MMFLIDVWCRLPSRLRCLCWGVWTLGWSGIVMAGVNMMARSQDILLQQRAAIRSQWRSLYRLKAAVDEQIIANEAKTLIFSPLRLQLKNAHLLYWRPAGQGGELAIGANWEAIPGIFMQLASQGVTVKRFTLSRQKDELLLTLQLEPVHGG
ncbi:TPA: hypothetical protein ACIPUI_003416 [Citrobacter freundii]